MPHADLGDERRGGVRLNDVRKISSLLVELSKRTRFGTESNRHAGQEMARKRSLYMPPTILCASHDRSGWSEGRTKMMARLCS